MDAILTNNILYSNSANLGPDVYTQYSASSCQVNYNCIDTSLIYGNWSGGNNIFADPLFENAENLDFHITSESPCIDAGDPAYPNNADTTTADIGAFYFDQRPIVALEASEITGMSFQANWQLAEDADGYLLDVANDENFVDILEDYQNLDVGNVFSYLIEGLSPLTSYFYRVRANYDFGRSGYSNIINTSTITSVDYLPAYPVVNLNIFPNPLSSSSSISYSIPQKSLVVLDIYNINGKCIQQLVNKVQESGEYEIVFDGRGLPAGIYFCVLKTSQTIETKKIIKLD